MYVDEFPDDLRSKRGHFRLLLSVSGDAEVPFTIQSSGKPLNYAIALSELGADTVHQYVGQEPSGRMFNELVLDHNRKPHNPMVNAGAIIIASTLLNLIEPEMRASEKFDWVRIKTKDSTDRRYCPSLFPPSSF